MFKLVAFALAALSTVNALAIFPRQNPPAGWNADILECYEDYHTRYLAIGCQNEHNTEFFSDCCHPLKKGETLQSNRKPYCSPGYQSSSSLAPEPTSVLDSEGDNDGDDDCENEPASSPVNKPSSTQTPAPTPYNEPTPTPSSTDSPIPSPTDSPTPSPTSSPTPSPTDSPTPSPTSSPTPSPTPDQGTSTETHTGGHLTWFTQNGNAGACGQVHSDNDFVAALDYRTYGDSGVHSSYCGKTIRITWQGKSVDVVVADDCPSCDNASSVDLSLAAFQALAPLSTGLLTDATWELLG